MPRIKPGNPKLFWPSAHARQVHSPSRHTPGATTISAGPLELPRSPWNTHFLANPPRLRPSPVACAPSSCGPHSVARAEVPTRPVL
jgi:hypothetical protein